jgi:hypothetical protein
MHIETQDLEAAFAKANELNDHYKLTHLTGNDPQKYIDYILTSCDALGVGVVRIVEVDIAFSDSAVYSLCVMNGNGQVDIVLAKGLNHCWRRYAVCKELVHVLIDQEQYRNLNVSQHTENVSIAFPLDDGKPDLAVAAEFLAEVAAMEFLFPYSDRVRVMSQTQPPNFPALAQLYRIPQLLVDRYLTINFMAALRPFSRGP